MLYKDIKIILKKAKDDDKERLSLSQLEDTIVGAKAEHQAFLDKIYPSEEDDEVTNFYSDDDEKLKASK